MKEIKEEAEKIIELFKGKKIYEEKGSTKYTLVITIEQAKEFALIYCDGIIKEFPVNAGFDGVLDNMFKYFINSKRQYWQQVKEYIQNNY